MNRDRISLLAILAVCLVVNEASAATAMEKTAIELEPVVVTATNLMGLSVHDSAVLTTKPQQMKNNEAPQAPAHLRPASRSGSPAKVEVIVAYTVDREGNVWDAHPLRVTIDTPLTDSQMQIALEAESPPNSSGSEIKAAFGKLLGEVATAAVRRWKFAPGRLGVQPVAARMSSTVLFTIALPERK